MTTSKRLSSIEFEKQQNRLKKRLRRAEKEYDRRQIGSKNKEKSKIKVDRLKKLINTRQHLFDSGAPFPEVKKMKRKP